MSPLLKRLLRRALKWVGLVFFLVAAYAIYTQLSKYSWMDIQTAIENVPASNVLYAVLAMMIGYVVLSTYDRLALEYINRKVEWYKWMLAGFLGFAVSNNAGTAIVSGAAIRYRLYTRWRFQMPEIFTMISFSGVTYLIGCLFLFVIGFSIVPAEVRQSPLVTILFWPCLVALVLYFIAAAVFKRGGFMFGKTVIRVPGVWLALRQGMLGTTDTFLASMVLYSVLYPLFPVPFDVFVGVFAISMVIGVFTPVPGAVGVFEGLFLYLLPGAAGNEAQIFGALIIFRIVYYLIPLVTAGIVLFILPQYLRLRSAVPLATKCEVREKLEKYSGRTQ